MARRRCRKCGAIEGVEASSAAFSCAACKSAGRSSNRFYFHHSTGRNEASACVGEAIRTWKLPRPNTLPCADCDQPASAYDHRDYNKPLQVVAVCDRCNARRGPAIPLTGSVEMILACDAVPYRHRFTVEKLLRTMGRDPAVLAGMPKRLEVEHWREFWPVKPAFATPDGELFRG